VSFVYYTLAANVLLYQFNLVYFTSDCGKSTDDYDDGNYIYLL